MQRQLYVASLVLLAAAPALGRTWSDASGNYNVEADLVGFTDDSVILLRGDHHLAAIETAKLSEADQKYAASEEARLAAQAANPKQQTWTTQGGLSILGHVVDYVSRDVTLQRKRGKVFVNDRAFSNLPKVYQMIVPKIVANFENNKVSDEKTLEAWLVHRKGSPATYRCDGVIIELPSGEEYAFPFFLFRESDLELLRPGWDSWAGANEDYAAREQAADQLRTLAADHQSNQQATQQIARLQLGLQAVEAGVTELWEVTLYPGRGVSGSPVWAVVPGRDSRVATANALAKNPGYVAGPARRVSR